MVSIQSIYDAVRACARTSKPMAHCFIISSNYQGSNQSIRQTINLSKYDFWKSSLTDLAINSSLFFIDKDLCRVRFLVYFQTTMWCNIYVTCSFSDKTLFVLIRSHVRLTQVIVGIILCLKYFYIRIQPRQSPIKI